ncbi:MAG: HGGxSTG domain-containing protein [Rhodospirillales bacterium]
MQQAPRCGAKTRKGSPCQSPAMKNGRCRMHGGLSTGAPKGNKNAFKHGYYTAESIAQRRMIRALLKESRELVASI